MKEQLPDPGERVVVAMSGGVDSSVVAALLHERGCEVVGVTLSLYEAPADDAFEGGCCTPSDISDARRVCAALGVPHYVLDYRADFDSHVIDTFVNAYKTGTTPNPCVVCNNVLKFDFLLGRSLDLDARWLATGHYAQAVRDDEGRPRLLAGRDPLKDQSYFLYGMARTALERLTFPLGGQTKEQARAHARRLGVRTSDKPDSQDICFVGEGKVADFVASRGGAGEPGDIVDEAGRVLGRHDGVHAYTIGQRRGLGISAEQPLYVQRIDAARRRLVVTPPERLDSDILVVADWAWLRPPEPGEALSVRVRYRSRPANVAAVSASGSVAELRLAAPVRAAAPGQAVVLYGGEGGGEVLGGGTLRAAR